MIAISRLGENPLGLNEVFGEGVDPSVHTFERLLSFGGERRQRELCPGCLQGRSIWREGVCSHNVSVSAVYYVTGTTNPPLSKVNRDENHLQEVGTVIKTNGKIML
jgi:hypothetical protein